jgi:hypothetical protein
MQSAKERVPSEVPGGAVQERVGSGASAIEVLE